MISKPSPIPRSTHVVGKVTLQMVYALTSRIATALFGDTEAGTLGVIHRTEALEDRVLSLEKDKAGNSELRLLETKFAECPTCFTSQQELKEIKVRLGKLDVLAIQLKTAVWIGGLLWTASTVILGLIIAWTHDR